MLTCLKLGQSDPGLEPILSGVTLGLVEVIEGKKSKESTSDLFYRHIPLHCPQFVSHCGPSSIRKSFTISKGNHYNTSEIHCLKSISPVFSFRGSIVNEKKSLENPYRTSSKS